MTTSEDVYGLGVTIAQAVVGRVGPVEDLRASSQPSVCKVVDQATHFDLARRPRRLLDIVRVLRVAVGVPEHAPEVRLDVPNPYKGLRAFDATDADRFAGRERIVADLLRRIEAARPCRTIRRLDRAERVGQVQHRPCRCVARVASR